MLKSGLAAVAKRGSIPSPIDMLTKTVSEAVKYYLFGDNPLTIVQYNSEFFCQYTAENVHFVKHSYQSYTVESIILLT